jgi:hypothetical protein
MNLREIDHKYVDWANLAEGRDQWWVLLITRMNLRIPKSAGNFLTT